MTERQPASLLLHGHAIGDSFGSRRTNLSIDDKDFAVVPILARKGRRSTAPKVFGDRLVPLIHALNEAIAA